MKVKYRVGQKLVVTGIDKKDAPPLSVGDVVSFKGDCISDIIQRTRLIVIYQNNEWYINPENVKPHKPMFSK